MFNREFIRRLIIFFLLLFSGISFAEVQHVKAAIQMSSLFSDGDRSISEIVETAKKNDIKVVIFADRDFMNWEYGIWPFRGLIKRRVESNSIAQHGFDKYFAAIEEEQKKNPEMVLIPAVETAPYYYWSGGPFNKTLKIHDWHKHLLVLGLNQEELRKLPVVANDGISRKYNQYMGKIGPAPYQNVIDYVNSKNGLIYWLHPDAEYIQERGDVKIETKQYPEDLLKTKNYTGFSIFYDGYINAGKPGGVWDQVLMNNKIWAIGALGYDQGDLDFRMKDLKTILILDQHSKESVVKALKKGKLYVVLGKRDVKIEKYSIDKKGRVAFSAMISGEKPERIKVRLIKNGKVIKVFKQPEFVYTDKDIQAKDYYRIDMEFKGGRIISNPIFVNR
ncbi:hypothetical protein ACFL52_03820 [Candidatus Margulisiibacteriota bacterium]